LAVDFSILYSNTGRGIDIILALNIQQECIHSLIVVGIYFIAYCFTLTFLLPNNILCCHSLYRVNTLYFLLATFLHFFATLPASRAGDFVNFYDDAIFKHNKKVTSYNKY
jgi:hypothetical protein